MLEARCASTALVDRNRVDGSVESNVGVFPIEDAREVLTQSVVRHDVIMPTWPTNAKGSALLCEQVRPLHRT
jgi:hypothetical protein